LSYAPKRLPDYFLKVHQSFSPQKRLMKIEKIIRVLIPTGPPADEVGGLRSCAPLMGLFRPKKGPQPDSSGAAA